MQNRSSEEVRVTAKTVDVALKEAASLLNVEQGDVDYRVVSQTNGGFFSFLAKKVEIAAWSKVNGSSKKRVPASASTNEQADMSDREIEELKDDLREFCAGICQYVSGQDVKVTAELADQRLILDIDDEYMSAQIAKNSKLAESLEHILRKKPRHLKRELPFRIFVDVKGVRRKRETDLVELARDLSEKVHENKRPIVLNYKSSYDRKIIHMALDKDDRVYTKSIGTGPNRKLMILPIKKKDEADGQYEQV
ncbi:R3H domain-containing nucleic acid-binding protein [Pseudobacteriovorax antillogorgiicola]|uniref:SpoIIIJ-associated protein n=1 Tax=Pseudobacteriovorax antillogorgiicola TaxID=1513793 RepID=A0A1Y6CHX7_9BACT|nr:R3H domain-containing nucleic acid-binding protein [Pseudobacteriovorax antillogorgiicola]TCS46681.1 spoIIIJ-associated protein [Pseudobacteriovorax antillogorgiicola]SMF66695.1 spoIIIJ-associated protein [Pseudobacteriovorax antillogorgiicola]